MGRVCSCVMVELVAPAPPLLGNPEPLLRPARAQATFMLTYPLLLFLLRSSDATCVPTAKDEFGAAGSPFRGRCAEYGQIKTTGGVCVGDASVSADVVN